MQHRHVWSEAEALLRAWSEGRRPSHAILVPSQRLIGWAGSVWYRQVIERTLDAAESLGCQVCCVSGRSFLEAAILMRLTA